MNKEIFFKRSQKADSLLLAYLNIAKIYYKFSIQIHTRTKWSKVEVIATLTLEDRVFSLTWLSVLIM